MIMSILNIKRYKKRIKALLVTTLLLGTGVVQAQVVIEGNVYGGGKLGEVSKNTVVTVNNGTVGVVAPTTVGEPEDGVTVTGGNVFGGGQGSATDKDKGLVEGNTTVNVTGGTVYYNVYGGGEMGSVGRGLLNDPNKGTATVNINGGEIGPNGMRMPDNYGNVFGGSMGITGDTTKATGNPLIPQLANVDATRVLINGTAFVKGSVYGGSFNGHVLDSTYVTIAGGQIGCAKNMTTAYDNSQFVDPTTTTITSSNTLAECASWVYGKDYGSGILEYYPYDPNASAGNATARPEGSDGHTFYGNVFGGGSGYYPWNTVQDHSEWLPTAGVVRGNTYVEITGGHILTAVYGGCETTDVGVHNDAGELLSGGNVTIRMDGGTVGVPRDSTRIAQHPVTCSLFGAGKGDPRVYFNTWTDVGDVDMEISGGIVYGSVFGGGEEGHVLDTVLLTIKDNAKIGTLGYSRYDGNVFGGGRGFTGDALTAGTVGGNIQLNIEGGKMLGSVYGGGRLGSVGTYLVPVEDVSHYGAMQPGEGHGYIFVNISGGTIGNDHETLDAEHTIGGNVFGGGMGRILTQTGANSPIWPFLARAKQTRVNITGGTIKSNVYGGSELGVVRDSAIVVINGENAVVNGDVYGGGFGSKNTEVMTSTIPSGSITASPLQHAGSVRGNALVKIKNGWVKQSVYGGGELATVGQSNTGAIVANTGLAQIAISGGKIGTEDLYETDDPTSVDKGHVYGGGKGIPDDESDVNYKKYSNVNHTKITVSGGQVYGTVYGGSADGHVLGNDSVFILTGATIGTNGLSGYDGGVFGGGKGSGYYVITGTGDEADTTFAMYKTCGRVAGNNYVKIDGGTVKASVYGGGRLALTGVDEDGDPSFRKAGSATVYDSINHGLALVDVRGESFIGIPETQDLLESFYSVGDIFGGGQGDLDYYDVPEAGCVANAIVNVAGNATIYCTVFGGGEIAGVGYMDESGKFLPGTGATRDTIGGTAKIGSSGEFSHDYLLNPTEWTMFDTVNDVRRILHTCSGNVFGASQGDASPNYPNWIHLGHSRTAEVVVKENPIIRSSVFGGAEQGTVTENTYVKIMGGTIGTEGVLADSLHPVIPSNLTSTYNYGSVFGGGFGVDTLRVDSNVNDSTMYPNFLAGRVYGNTYVTISEGTIRGNVYGGGNLASVGVEKNDGTRAKGKCFVTISGEAIIGEIDGTGMNANVFGGGRGFPTDPNEIRKAYANVNSTEVTVSGGSVKGSVYGGGAYSHVLDSTDVIVSGGTIGTTGFGRYDGSVFGGGRGNLYNFSAGRVAGNTQVAMNNGTVLGNVYGGGLVALTGVDVNGHFDSFIDVENEDHVYDSLHHGLTKVEVSGGTVGNFDHDGLDLLRSNYKVGNVYGGGRGNIDEYIEDDLGRAANAVVDISGEHTKIYGNVFGGGQMANVGHWNNYTSWYTQKTGATRVTITGSPEIGTQKEYDHEYSLGTDPAPKTWYDTINDVRMISHTLTGNVFGGGQGNVKIMKIKGKDRVVGLEQGHCHTTDVNISGTPTIWSSVFGGSEEGAVWGDTKVVIAGGTIGKQNIVSDSLHPVIPEHLTGTYSFGHVFGGSYGADWLESLHLDHPSQNVMDSVNSLAGRVYGNSSVVLTGGTICGNVFGGGDMASTGGNTSVSVSGSAFVGPLDHTGLNAYIFGGGKGFPHDPDELRKAYANVNNTFVTVSGGTICGSIFGGGNDSHVLGDASIEVHSGANIGTDGLSTWDGNIFGGGRNFLNTNHTNGRVEGNIDITMDGGTIQGSIFGGGRMALSGVDKDGVFPTTSWDPDDHGNVTIHVSGSSVIGNDAHDGLDLLTLSDESVGDIFGSGKGDTKNYDDPLAGAVTSTDITITGSPRIHGAVFGGGEMASVGHWGSDGKFIDGTGATTVTIGAEGHPEYNPTIGTYKEFDPVYLSAYPADEIWTIYDYDEESHNYTVTHTCTGNVFGGCQGDVDVTLPHWVSHARSKSSDVTIYSGTIMGGVFGGSEQGTVAGDTKVTVKGGTIGTIVNEGESNEYYFGNVYGAGYGSDDPEEDDSTAPNDSINANPTLTPILTPIHIAGRTYGNSEVNLLGGTIRGSVFGGAAYASVGYGSHGNATLNIGNATQSNYAVHGNFYGANNNNGTVMGDVEVYVNAGTIGNGTGVQSDVFGGGFGESTAVNGNVTVTVDSLDHVTAPIIYGDVYGGSAFGSVNNANTDKTIVNILAGSILKTEIRGTTYGGDVYGGGLGESGNINKGKVYGAITVNIGDSIHQPTRYDESVEPFGYATIGNNVYGANNTGGSPQDNVTVNIFGTAHTAANVAEGGTEFAIQNVFGGGNYADYKPRDGSGNPVLKQSSVYIFGCDNTVGRVFGGGDASASPNVKTDIQGGRFDQVFGGGNGELGEDYGADIDGDIDLAIHGGTVNMFFVGSNQHGVIHGNTNLLVDNDGPCGASDIDEFFCGGNFVPITGNVDAVISCNNGLHVRNLYGGCNQAVIQDDPATPAKEGNVNLVVEGGHFENVYGGSKGRLETDQGGFFDAYITGNVTLTITGGTIDTVFGGSNKVGSVRGKISVIIDDAGNEVCPLIVHNVYGGGRGAAYEPDSVGFYPQVQVKKGTISKKQQVDANGDPVFDEHGDPVYEEGSGSVFGGGFGSTAIVNTTTHPNLNPNPNITHNGPKVIIGGSTTSTDKATVEGNVYGGGHGAEVVGDPHVILDGSSVVDVQGNVYGGGRAAAVSGNAKVEVK